MGKELASYVIVAWVALVVAAFPAFTPRRGMIFILLSAWLFLPPNLGNIVELGPLKFGKWQALSYAMILAAICYDSERLFALRPSWADAPILIWSVCPAFSVIFNDPAPDGGSYFRDVVSNVFTQSTTYLFPYLIGRMYFFDAEGFRELAEGFVIAGLVYVPFCLFEVRMSPNLNHYVYGYMPHSFAQQMRFGGFRPMVFMGHGLAVAQFMAIATMLALWSRTEGASERWLNWAIWILLPTLILCKSVGAIVLASVGLGLYFLKSPSAVRIVLLCMAMLPPTYCIVRSLGIWDGSALVDIASANIEKDRGDSLDYRLRNENLLIEKALQQPVFGWGGWGRNRVFSDDGHDMTVTDGLWIIVLGVNGIVGLAALGAVVLLPVVRYAVRLPAIGLQSANEAPVTCFAIIAILTCIDSLFNIMAIPLAMLIAGGLTGLLQQPEEEVVVDVVVYESIPDEPDGG